MVEREEMVESRNEQIVNKIIQNNLNYDSIRHLKELLKLTGTRSKEEILAAEERRGGGRRLQLEVELAKSRTDSLDQYEGNNPEVGYR